MKMANLVNMAAFHSAIHTQLLSFPSRSNSERFRCERVSYIQYPCKPISSSRTRRRVHTFRMAAESQGDLVRILAAAFLSIMSMAFMMKPSQSPKSKRGGSKESKSLDVNDRRE
mmetsp:Transcript_18331/g.31756  ORF Transcript_18331/g.31756 Transcript_18331/m.31756 type:complete len:114 (+) Transcript_18331:171-512(+)